MRLFISRYLGLSFYLFKGRQQDSRFDLFGGPRAPGGWYRIMSWNPVDQTIEKRLVLSETLSLLHCLIYSFGHSERAFSLTFIYNIVNELVS